MPVLDAPQRGRVPKADARDARRGAGVPMPRRDPVPEIRGEFLPRRTPGREVDAEDDAGQAVISRRRPGWSARMRSRFPRSVVGRVATGLLVLAGLGVIGYGLHEAQGSLEHDARLTIPSSRAIEITGNNHLTHAQLLSVFGEDVDRNVLTIPLAARRAELEALPWVEHATVMRLLPNRVRVAIVERTPVAFVRQGNEIGLVDAHGVLLDLAPDAEADRRYSFPVLTGIEAGDPASTRLARMKLYLAFTSELDAGTSKVSRAG